MNLITLFDFTRLRIVGESAFMSPLSMNLTGLVSVKRLMNHQTSDHDGQWLQRIRSKYAPVVVHKNNAE